MTAEPWPNETSVHQIAFALLDRSPEQRHLILVDAFKQAIARHPDVAEPELDPRIVLFVGAIYRCIYQMERDQGHG